MRRISSTGSRADSSSPLPPSPRARFKIEQRVLIVDGVMCSISIAALRCSTATFCSGLGVCGLQPSQLRHATARRAAHVRASVEVIGFRLAISPLWSKPLCVHL